jgi:multiple sugar transport system substrate-binding protein
VPWGSIALRADSLLLAACGSYNPPGDPNHFTFNTPQNVKAFQWVHDLIWRFRYGGVTAEEMGGSGGYTLAGGRDPFFRSGQVAMLLDGTHLLGTYKSTAQIDWDVAPLPKGPCGHGEYASVDGYVIPVGARSPDASWAVVQAITDKEANRMRAEIVGLVPARKSQMEAWAKTIPGKSLQYAVATDDAHPDSSALWPRPNDVLAVVSPIWESLFVKNELTVPDALKQMNDAVAGVLGPAAVR